ncbi:enoyl-CoA hydratase/isomerase family protein [Pseudoponticoccus marisrubri]|uniref:Uncharacterized protein n=1 Tax=Pseudoponticoccus marisrubri TaxID=1685382 RepID=A0A0W7WIC3_9RHOB|nr:enoyl-CoA hydratase/isomerase family protein [Pseudoponticoccus marisrubri]KUF10287.1 hypothetical protein AVJ23_12835 [Pseudoponticoccus marisrubri]
MSGQIEHFRQSEQVSERVGYEVAAGVAYLSIANPPVNALSRDIREDLMEALDRAEEEDGVEAIVLIGSGGTFPAGADLNEYDDGLQEPFLRDLCERVAYCETPVVAALSGTVFGGGLELALAAHYRLALQGTRLSLPEIRMGLTPSAGATQRLPRLVGAELALDMMLSGRILTVDRAPGQQLVDAVCSGDLRMAAAQFCARLAGEDPATRRLSERRDGLEDAVAFQAAVAAHRARLDGDPEDAAHRIVHLVEAAALLPFEAGLAMEEDAFEATLASDAARALRHAFVAEHVARRGFAAPVAPVRMERVAVLGAGPLALQIAVSALNAGLCVDWGMRDTAHRHEGEAQLRDLLAAGRDADARAEALDRLRIGDSAAMTDRADIILHAARGQGDVPAPEGVVRAVAMAGRVDRVGLRFAPPVFATRLVEIIEGPDCAPGDLAAALALADRLHKVPVHVRSTGESLAGRLAAAMQRAADGLVDLGADPYAIDAALEDWGLARPPFKARDMAGLETLAHAERGAGATNWSAEIAGLGRTGWVAGLGFYDWEQRVACPSAAVTRHLDTARAPVKWPAEDLRRLVIGAMANEGTRLLAEGMARRASDLDVVSLLALDLPRPRGGVMKAVSLWGVFGVMKTLERLGHPDADFWQPQPAWAELVKYGQSFDDL